MKFYLTSMRWLVLKHNLQIYPLSNVTCFQNVLPTENVMRDLPSSFVEVGRNMPQ